VTGPGPFGQSASDIKAVEVLDALSKETGKSITSLALAWVLHKEPYLFPIVGGRKVEQLIENIDALSISLTPEQIKRIDGAVPLHKGFPYEMFGSHPSESRMMNMCGSYQWPEGERPIL